MDIRIGHVETDEDVTRQGNMAVRILGADQDSPLTPVSYTTPTFSPPTGGESHKFTGSVGVPGKGAYVLIGQSVDDNKYYYISAITGSANYKDLDKLFGNKTLVGGPEGKYTKAFPFSEDPDTSVYSHDVTPQKYGIESPKGGKFQISDSASEEGLQYFTKLESMTNKKIIADDVSDYIAMENEHGDGLKITSHKYDEDFIPGPGPGGRSAQLQANQNIFIESDSGSVNVQVKGGYQLNIQNESCNVPLMRPTPADTKVGELNIESNANSVNIRTFNREFIYDPASTSMPSKGIFIDASMFQGVVQIKAGKGGLEFWSEGDVDFNCAGDFNVNAVGDINLTGQSPFAATYWAAQAAFNPAPPKFPKGPGPGLVNLNNPLGWTQKPFPTFNNDQLYPLN